MMPVSSYNQHEEIKSTDNGNYAGKYNRQYKHIYFVLVTLKKTNT